MDAANQIKHDVPSICVLGGGVIGLSTATTIQESIKSAQVTIIADELSPNTTSDVAAGLWELDLDGSTPQDEQLRKWALETAKYLEGFLRSGESAEIGLQRISGYYLRNEYTPVYLVKVPSWWRQVHGFREASEEEIISFFPDYRYGWFMTLLTLECLYYLPWLMKRYKLRGGIVIKRFVNSLEEIAGDYDVIVNCTGLGAKQLVIDEELYPVKGQIFKVRAPWIKHFAIHAEAGRENKGELCHVIPGKEFVTVGGTYKKGDWSLEFMQVDGERIWRDCLNLAPSIDKAEIVHKRVGLRPSRSEVRLELETMNVNTLNIQVVHNYGHGGRGVTVHKGCALAATKLVKEALERKLK